MRRVTERVVALFGEDEFVAWSGTIARAALHVLTDEHIRHATSAAAVEAAANRRRLPLIADA